MLQNDYTQPMQQHRNKLMTVGLHLFVAIVFVGFFAASCPSVHAAGYMYSDMWMDDSSPTGNYAIAGCGVTEGSYSDMHEYHVESRIASPNGRYMANDSGGYSPAYARADVWLSGDFADLGDYYISSDHWEFCIHGDGGEQNWMFAGSTFADLTISLKKTAEELVAENASKCQYNPTCFGRCTTGSRIATKEYPGPCPGRYVQCEVLYSGGICFPDIRVCAQQNAPGTCDP